MTTSKKIDASEAVRLGRRANDVELEPMVVDDVDEGEAAPSAFDEAIARARAEIDAHRERRTDVILGGESLADLVNEEIPAIDWLVRGLLTRDAVGLIGAEAKGTKTWCGCELMIALATGTDVFGRFHVPKIEWSLAFFLEDHRRNVRSRFKALCAGRQIGTDALSRIRLLTRSHIDLRETETLAWILAHVRAMPTAPGLIYIDPLRDAHGAEENSSSEMAPVMGALRVLRDLSAATVLSPHHMGRPSQEKAGMRLAHRLRGSTAIFGAVDAAICIETQEREQSDTHRRWVNLVDVELREAPGAGQFSLELDVQLGSDGTARTAGWATPELRATSKTLVVQPVVRERVYTFVASQEGRPVGEKAVREAAGVGLGLAREALQQLGAAGRIRQVLSPTGKKMLGWAVAELRNPSGTGAEPSSATADPPGSGTAELSPLGEFRRTGSAEPNQEMDFERGAEPAGHLLPDPGFLPQTDPATWQVRPPLVGARRATVTHRIDLGAETVGPELRGAFCTELARRLAADEDRVRLNALCGEALGLLQ